MWPQTDSSPGCGARAKMGPKRDLDSRRQRAGHEWETAHRWNTPRQAEFQVGRLVLRYRSGGSFATKRATMSDLAFKQQGFGVRLDCNGKYMSHGAPRYGSPPGQPKESSEESLRVPVGWV